jgi:hypothetical protein
MGNYTAIAEIAAGRIEQRSKAHAYRDDPVKWATEFMGLQVWSKQKEILYSIRDNRATAVAAGHGVGKSWIAALAACWWIDTHPLDEVFVASTAPTVDQVNAILWTNIKKFHELAKRRYDEGITDHPLPGYVTNDSKWKTDSGVLIGQGRKPPNEASDVAFQGVHATYLLAIGDEAVGLNAGMIGALANIATGVHNRQLLIANPTDPTCEMAKIWVKETESWNRMHISVFDSPLVTNEPGFDQSRAEGMSGWNYINERREEWGEDDPRYIARVLGQWAFDSGNTVFSEGDITNCLNAYVLPDPDAPIHLGVDIAWSDKGDFSSVYSCQSGEVWETDDETGKPDIQTGRRGWVVRRVAIWKGAPLAGHNPDNPSNADRIIEFAQAVGGQFVKVDSSGVGMAVIQDLASRNLTFDLYKMAGGDPARESRTYTNSRAEAFFDMKIAAHQGLLDLDIDDEDFIDQLRSIQYEYDARNRIKIQSKADMRKEGKRSPDFADAAWYAFYIPEDMRESGPKKGDVITFNAEDYIPDWYEDLRGLPV